MKAQDFTFDTAFKKGLRLSEEVKKADRTFLIFLRYFGCTSCQLDMIDLAENAENFKARNAQVLVVLQSRPEIAGAGSDKFSLPFDIICDPNAEIYHLYDVKSAGSKEGLRAEMTEADGMKFAKKMERRDALGLEHGEYEGDEYQLPAYFLIDSNMELIKSHHAKSIADMPLADEYLEML